MILLMGRFEWKFPTSMSPPNDKNTLDKIIKILIKKKTKKVIKKRVLNNKKLYNQKIK
jgi:hypothetical protein